MNNPILTKKLKIEKHLKTKHSIIDELTQADELAIRNSLTVWKYESNKQFKTATKSWKLPKSDDSIFLIEYILYKWLSWSIIQNILGM